VKLFSAGWHVPQVLPLPLNVSLKKMRLPLAINSACGSGGGGRGLWQDVTTAKHSRSRDSSFIFRGFMIHLLSQTVRYGGELLKILNTVLRAFQRKISMKLLSKNDKRIYARRGFVASQPMYESTPDS
jgi:hypothetical protein